MKKLHTLALIAMALTALSIRVYAQELTLKEAEKISLDSDPLARQFQSRVLAQENMAIADGQLPDPQLSFGALNIPTDTFNTDQEAMTQFQVEVFQQIPNFGTLNAKTEIASALSRIDKANAAERKLVTLKAVRLSWLDAIYWKKALLILEDYKFIIEDDIRSIQAKYSSGRINAQRVIEAELASSLLDDRALDAIKELDSAKANLSKWIGENAEARILPDILPVIAKPLQAEAFHQELKNHPTLKVYDEQEAASNERVKLAEAAYGPKFGVGAAYGYRQDTPKGETRSNLVSFKFSMSVPFFTGARQDRKLSARKHEAAAARLSAEEQLRELTRQYQMETVAYERTQQRLLNFDEQVLKRAKDNVSAAIAAYQYEASDFDALVRARVSELETQLKHLRLEVESLKSLVRLQYLQGETL
jgi:outer membrane protein TolC